MSTIFTKLDAQLLPLPADTPLDQTVAIRVQVGELDFICAPLLAIPTIHATAKTRAAELVLAGSSWRMSRIEEELAILDWSRIMPSKDPNFFGEEIGGVWTDDEVPGYPGYFRVVGYANGGIECMRGDSREFFARPVLLTDTPDA